jgi:hypothetical protein
MGIQINASTTPSNAVLGPDNLREINTGNFHDSHNCTGTKLA